MKLFVLLIVSAVIALAATQSTGKADPKVEIGKPAPSFRLNGEDGKAVQLGPGGEAFWTVLAFYPKAATPG